MMPTHWWPKQPRWHALEAGVLAMMALIAYYCARCQPSLWFVRAHAGDEGLILGNGHGPAWPLVQP